MKSDQPATGGSSHHDVPEAEEQDFGNSNFIVNRPAPSTSYFTPGQFPPAGTATDPQPNGKPIPKLFQPLKIRGLTLQNRIMVSPLCQYSADDGHHTMWHYAHLGGIISRGPGLTMVEATSVTPEGRITPEDSGLWKDSQIEPLKKICEFAHSQGQKIAIQIAHAGRKASTAAPWLASGDIASENVGGWPKSVLGPSAEPWNENHAVPKAMTLQDIDDFKTAWVATVKRALKAGFDVIEIHNAHGYLLHSFLSPASNHRTDHYGGSFANRTRLTCEIVELTRKTIPDDMPLFLRISASDWLQEETNMESWKVEDTARLAPILAEKGVDLLDVSSGGNHPKQHPHAGPAYQAPFAYAIKRALPPNSPLLIGTVGKLTTGPQANAILNGTPTKEQMNVPEGFDEGASNDGSSGNYPPLDLAIVGRYFQKDPSLMWTWAEQCGVEVNVANQIRWGFGGRPGGK